mmetsp:Transcript_5758/g.13392  ORF Transcript_5758/g.13392 Transcript_5758/m.13392 type:complete len:349 (-) Transcript_5758:49-1095(-)
MRAWLVLACALVLTPDVRAFVVNPSHLPPISARPLLCSAHSSRTLKLQKMRHARKTTRPVVAQASKGDMQNDVNVAATNAELQSELTVAEIQDKLMTFSRVRQTLMAFVAATGAGVLAFGIEQSGTYLILETLKRSLGIASFVDLIDYLTKWAAASNFAGVVATALVATVLQILPIFNGILLSMGIGCMWGAVKGVAIASFAATTSAVICLLIARYGLRDLIAGKEPALLSAVGESIGSSNQKSLLIVSLFRLSPVIPYCWSNYLLGLTKVKLIPYILGTVLGTLPALSVFVSAGMVGKKMAEGTASAPPELVLVGILATVGVLSVISKISQQELSKIASKEKRDIDS